MKIFNQFTQAFLFFLVCQGLFSCSTIPITGRNQLMLVNPRDVEAASASFYAEVVANSTPCRNARQIKLVQTVAGNLIQAAEQYFIRQGQEQVYRQKFQWEINLVEAPEVNAFCMAGGKIMVNTGILPVAENTHALAAIIGHEIAHAMADHVAERLSHQMMGNAIFEGLLIGIGNSRPVTQDMISIFYGLGNNLIYQLPFQRKHEYEADRMGLILMTMAGYDPREASAFWDRMAALSGNKPPAFLSTHPADQKRKANLEQMIPEALAFARSMGVASPKPKIKL